MKEPMPLYKAISRTIGCMGRIKADPAATDWTHRHRMTLEKLMELMPSGSGVDSGTKLVDTSTPEKLIFVAPFHHMNENGYYDGWTDHTITVKPSLEFDFELKISGKDRNQIKDFYYEIFDGMLREPVNLAEIYTSLTSTEKAN